MKKICLVMTKSSFLLDERVFPFLGILKVASAWRQLDPKINIDVLDLSGIDNDLDVVQSYMEANSKDLEFVGITATTPQIKYAYEVGRLIKENWNDTKLVLGGSHITLMNTASKNEIKRGVINGRAKRDVDNLKHLFDVFVCGDGELTLDAVRQMKSGVIDVDDKKSPFFMSNKNFSELPNPARDLIDLNSYKYFIEGERATSLISQLGCPYRCSFCSGRSSPYLRLIRNRSVYSIIDELENLYEEYGYKGYMFYDDELNVNKQMIPLMRDISTLSNKLGVDFKLRGFTKSELFTDEQAEAMYEAGFRWLLTGYESGDPRILTNIDKNATRDENTRCVEIAKKHGLKVKALMSIAHAGESFETIENTKQWLLEVEPDDFDCTVISTFPGSPYFDFAEDDGEKYIYTSPKTGDKLYQKYVDYTQEGNFYKGTPGNYSSYVWTDYLTPEQLVEERDKLESDVRRKLNIPFNPSNPTKKFEQSYGSSKNLPDWILRNGKGKQPEKIKLDIIK